MLGDNRITLREYWQPVHVPVPILLAKAYKALGLICRTFSQSVSPSVKVKLYIALVRSQIMYSSPIWRPHLMKDIHKIEQLQWRATKYILQDYTSDYKTRLINLQLLPLMYTLEISDIMFFINSVKNPTPSFNINAQISYSSNRTRSNGVKLNHTIHHSTTSSTISILIV